MLNLGMLALITSLLHEPNDDRFSLKGALSRIEVADASRPFTVKTVLKGRHKNSALFRLNIFSLSFHFFAYI